MKEPEEAEQSDVEEGGGPVKSFLEHLEDLRWMLKVNYLLDKTFSSLPLKK